MSAVKITPPMRLLVDIPGWQRETMAMDATESGAMLHLKMYVWRVGPLPDNDKALASIAKLDVKTWKVVRKTLEPLFIVMHGEWQREDWNDELEAAYEAVRKASKAGKTAVNARWDRKKQIRSEYDPNTNRIKNGYESNTPSILNNKGTAPSQGEDVYRPGDDAVPPEWLDDLRIAEDSFLAGDGAVTTEVGRESGTAGGVA